MSQRRRESRLKGADGDFEIRLSPFWTAGLLGGAAGTLLVIHLLLQATHYLLRPLPWLLTNLFNVDAEDSVPTWYSAVALLFAAALPLVIGLSPRHGGDRRKRYWLGMGIGFALLSLDEIAGFHETLNTVISFSWAIPGLIGSAVVGLLYARFLYGLPRKTGTLFCVAAFVFLVGAAGIEMVTDPYFAVVGPDNLSYHLYNAAEEGMEMFGVVLFIYAVLDYMGGGQSVVMGIHIPLFGPR